MTKTKSTKSALISSVLALLLCFTMLIGTTFAWFTDSVTSAGNKIMSGTLQVDLELLDKDSGEWNSIKEDKTALFNNDKWEPGYTEVKMLKVENEGTLALKWKAKFVAEKELSILADVIDVYVLPYGVLDDANGVAYPADRNLDGYTKVGTLREFVNTIETTTYGNLEAGESAYLGIALKMQETANNDYQGLDLGGTFDILILATQLDSEEDSFGKDYDANAKFDEPTKVGTVADFEAAIANGEAVELTGDIVVESLSVAEGAVVAIDLNGNDLTVADADSTPTYLSNAGTLNIIGNGSFVVKQLNNNGTLNIGGGATLETSAQQYAIINGEDSVLTIDNATIVHNGSDCAVQNNGTTIINNATITSDSGVIDNEMGTLTINGGTFTNNGTYCSVIRDTNGNAETIINGGTFIQKGDDPLVNLGTTGKLTVNGGEFTADAMFCGYESNITVNAGTFKNSATVVDYIFNIDSLVPATSTATTNADGSVTVTVNN